MFALSAWPMTHRFSATECSPLALDFARMLRDFDPKYYAIAVHWLSALRHPP